MSEQKFPEDSIRPEEMSLDELIRSTKEEISQGAPTTFEPTLPADYAELVSEEEELLYDENEYDDRYRMPGVIKGLLYVCCVLAAAIVLAVFAWKCADGLCALTAEDHAFLTAMYAAETAQVVAKWCARNAAAQGGAAAITVDLRRLGLLHPRRHPPRVTGLGLSGRKMMLFTPDGAGQGGEYGEDCLRVSGSFSGAWGDAVFLPVFTSALKTALTAHGLPAPEYLT